MNRMVRKPCLSKRSLAASTCSRRSFTPARTAFRLLNCARVWVAMILARVVFPTPGGPCRIRLPTRSAAIARRSKRPSARIAFWPANSSSDVGLNRSAKGACCRLSWFPWWLNRSSTNRPISPQWSLYMDSCLIRTKIGLKFDHNPYVRHRICAAFSTTAACAFNSNFH